MGDTYSERAHKEILIESWSNAARVLDIRGFATGGPFAEEHTTNADRSRAASTYQVHGVPEGLQVSPQAAPVRRGECYVRVSLMMDGEPVQRLLAGYLTDGKTLSWPGTPLEGFLDGKGLTRVVTGTNPAAGVEISEAVPTNAFWILKSLRAAFVVDATVTNRTVQLRILDAASARLWSVSSDVDQTASESLFYSFAGVGYEADEFRRGEIIIGIPFDNKMFEGYLIQTGTGGLQAGDDYAAPVMVVEEWLQE